MNNYYEFEKLEKLEIYDYNCLNKENKSQIFNEYDFITYGKVGYNKESIMFEVNYQNIINIDIELKIITIQLEENNQDLFNKLCKIDNKIIELLNNYYSQRIDNLDTVIFKYNPLVEEYFNLTIFNLKYTDNTIFLDKNNNKIEKLENYDFNYNDCIKFTFEINGFVTLWNYNECEIISETDVKLSYNYVKIFKINNDDTDIIKKNNNYIFKNNYDLLINKNISINIDYSFLIDNFKNNNETNFKNNNETNFDNNNETNFDNNNETNFDNNNETNSDDNIETNYDDDDDVDTNLDDNNNTNLDDNNNTNSDDNNNTNSDDNNNTN